MNKIKDINEEVRIRLIGFEDDSLLTDLLKQYTKNNEKITYEAIPDAQDRVDLKEKYGMIAETQIIVVETDSKNKIITIDQLYTYDYTSSQQIDITEETITNAIVDITLTEKPQIYFVTGHGEYSIQNDMSILYSYLMNDVNDISTVDLLVTNRVPENADLLVISSPQKDFLDNEIGFIIDYINNGGKILWMNEPTGLGTQFPNMQRILDLFGAKFDDGIILEQDTNKMALNSPNYVIPTIASTTATKDIVTDGGILLINSARITMAESTKLKELNVSNQDILTTSHKALFRKEVQNSSLNKIESDEEGRFVLGTKLTKTINEEKQAVMYLLANNLIAVDVPITIGSTQMYPIQFYNNKDYLLNTMAELTDRTDSISIRKDTGAITYTATETQDTIIKVAIIVYPVLIIVAGIIIWIIRRRKK